MVGAFGISAFVTTVITVQDRATVRAKAALAREAEYRALADTGAAVQWSADERLGGIAERLTEIETRMASLERLLETVE